MFPVIPMRSSLSLRRGCFIFIFSFWYIRGFYKLCVYPLISYYNRNGARCSIGVGFPFLALEAVPDTDVSDAPEGFLDNFEDGGNGVLDPLDGVRTLKHTIVAYMSARARVTRAFTFQHVFWSRSKCKTVLIHLSLAKFSANEPRVGKW